MKIHVVKWGECLSTIAAHHGFRDYESIYNHPDNAALRSKRPNPNLIHPGDEVVIPDREVKSVDCGPGRPHHFIIKRARKLLHLRFRSEDNEPLANTPYVLSYEDEVIEDETDADGELLQYVPLALRAATIQIGERRYQFSIGGLNPLHDTDDEGASGLHHRLANLGLVSASTVLDPDADSAHVIALFQLLHELPVTGHLDNHTRKKLEDEHGC